MEPPPRPPRPSSSCLPPIPISIPPQSRSLSPSPLYYSDACNLLPRNRPTGYPHIIDTDDFSASTDTGALTLADGIATFLWNKSTALFDDFFDLRNDDFSYEYASASAGTDTGTNRGGLVQNMLIVRRKTLVVAGFRLPAKNFKWDPLLNAKIEDDGMWTNVYCSEDVVGRQETIDAYGTAFAATVLLHQLWKDQDLEGNLRVDRDEGQGA